MNRQPGGVGRWIGFAAALALIQAILTFATDQPGDLVAMAKPAIELAVLVALFALSPAWLRWLLRGVGLALLAALLFIKLADVGFDAAFDRDFDPVLDLYLLGDGWTLLKGSVGLVGASVGVGAILVVFALVVLALHWALGRLSAMSAPPTRPWAAGAALILAGLAFLPSDYGPAPATILAQEHVATSIASLRDTVAFRAALARDPYAQVPDDRLLAALKGKDVILAFVESYGRDAIEDPRYAPLVGRRLDAAQKEVESAGFQARSTWLTSPTFGGQSWLAHETLLSGLWVTGAGRYRELIRSSRATLVRDFRRAGWRSVAVMPAIADAWPEGRFFGYDRIYDAHSLGYRGLAFNWITMPDQYTLSALQRLELARPDRKPVFAEVALISSHAPFVPVPTLVAWRDIGDGEIFSPMVKGSESPDSVWRDLKRVQAKYAEAIDYSLASLSGFVKAYGDERTVVIFLGDHQPGNVITDQGASHDVPVHVFAKDPKVLAALDALGWTAGMRPPAGPSKWRMDQVRGQLIEAFSPGVAPGR